VFELIRTHTHKYTDNNTALLYGLVLYIYGTRTGRSKSVILSRTMVCKIQNIERVFSVQTNIHHDIHIYIYDMTHV